MSNELFRTSVERLSRIPGVRGALIVDMEVGVPVVAELAAGVDGNAVAALAASLFRRTGKALDMAEFGRLGTLQLESDDGHVVTGDAGDLIVVAIAERTAQLGLVRLEVHRVAGTLR